MNNKTTPKDFFLHLAVTVVLYSAVIAVINLSFSIINYAFPDKLAGYFSASSIAWPISMLVVLVPLLYVLGWFLDRDAKVMPEKLDIWVRKWRIYLTLFLSGGTIIGDLIQLINTYLNGEISSRFVYKVLVVLVVCGIVFAYYLLAYRNAPGKSAMWRNILRYAGIVVVVAVVVAGFVIVGTPAKQRAIRFDSTRVNDLSNIQWQIIAHWQRLGELPVSLKDLNDSISGTVVPTDPDTKESYQYTVSSHKSFELCATFSLPTPVFEGRGSYYGGGMGGVAYTEPAYIGGGNDSWKHEAGKVCFERKIDASRYPVSKVQTPVAI